LGSRMKDHKRDKDWWEEITEITMDHDFLTHEDLLEAEVAAIKSEHPRYNIVHNNANKHVWDADEIDAKADRLEAEAQFLRGRAEATRLINAIRSLSEDIDAARGNPAGTYERGLYGIYNDVDCHDAQYIPLLIELLEYARLDHRRRFLTLSHNDWLRGWMRTRHRVRSQLYPGQVDQFCDYCRKSQV